MCSSYSPSPCFAACKHSSPCTDPRMTCFTAIIPPRSSVVLYCNSRSLAFLGFLGLLNKTAKNSMYSYPVISAAKEVPDNQAADPLVPDPEDLGRFSARGLRMFI